MKGLEQVRTYISNLDKQQFYRYLAIFFVSYCLITGFLIYRYYRSINMLQKRIAKINQSRHHVRELLERYKVVRQQQEEVNTILEQDKDFKIGGYFKTIVNKHELTDKLTRDPETSSEELDNGYTEIKLYASFSNLNMQKLVELLDALEQNERIYTKELEIYKPEQNATINVNLLIATLEPKAETGEAEG